VQSNYFAVMLSFCAVYVYVVLCLVYPVDRVAAKKKVTNLVNDQRFKDQWYLGQLTSDYPGRHNSILSAWRKGATGKNVVIAVLDNGVQLDHPDLKTNINGKASYNYLDPGSPAQPTPNLIKFRDGTQLAGIIAMVANNKKCGIGVAFNSKIASVKILGKMNATQHAAAHSHLRNKVHIYSESYGPYDNGKIASRYQPQTINAILAGVAKGRQGLGSIFVKSCGSGGHVGDHCGADGTVNLIYNIAVAAAARDHSTPYNSEECASILTSAYTQHTNVSGQAKGPYLDMITVGSNSTCIEVKGGSSTATAMVSGIIALALSVNKKLSWRDVQYLVVAASKRNGLGGSWVRNGARGEVSHRYGFGILNAGRMVQLAKSWRSVPKMGTCYTPYLVKLKRVAVNQTVPLHLKFGYKIPLQGCPRVNVVEQVSVVASVQFARRGEIAIHLKSPAGTRSTLLGNRKNDVTKRPYKRWKFTSVHYWGERVEGEWEVTFTFSGKGKGYVRNAYIIFYGTKVNTGYAVPRSSYNLPNRGRGRAQNRGRGRAQNRGQAQNRGRGGRGGYQRGRDMWG